MTVGSAIQYALDFIEATHGHKDGDVYQNLLQARESIYPEILNEEMPERVWPTWPWLS